MAEACWSSSLSSPAGPFTGTPLSTVRASSAAAVPEHPLADLLAVLAQRALPPCLETSVVDAAIGHFLQLGAARHPDLEAVLAKIGWVNGQWTSPFVDILALRSALQHFIYSPQMLIGRGAYGAVHRGFHRETNEPIAIKQIKSTTKYGMCDATVREISILRELSHPNIIGLKDVVSTTDCRNVYLILELLDCDLHAARRHHGQAFDLHRVKTTMLQMLAGLQHAHAHGVMHRDLKPQNVLLSKETGLVKIADFGMARGFLADDTEAAYTDWVMTLLYRAPELLLGSTSYTSAVDVWSAGCVLAELFNGEPFFQSDNETGVLLDIFSKMGSPPPAVLLEMGTGRPAGLALERLPQRPPTPMHKLVPRLQDDKLGQDLLCRMLTFDPRLRITASQAMRHPWFAGLVPPRSMRAGEA